MARCDLKLKHDEFFDLTPRQLDALLKRHKSSLQSQELLFAQIASAIYNSGFRSPEKATSPLDFMPSQWSKKAKAASTPTGKVRMTKKRRKAIADGLRACFGPIAEVR